MRIPRHVAAVMEVTLAFSCTWAMFWRKYRDCFVREDA